MIISHPAILTSFEVERLIARLQAHYGGQLLGVEHAPDQIIVYLSADAESLAAHTLLENPLPLSADTAIIQADDSDTATITLNVAVAAPTVAVWLDEAPFMEETPCPDGVITLKTDVPGAYRIEVAGDGRLGAITIIAQEVQ